MDKHKLILPISILLGCVILGGFYYKSQENKLESIERQQWIDLQDKQRRTDAEQQAKHEAESARTEIDKAKADQEIEDKNFANNLKCQTLLKDLKQRWNNVVGIYYSSLLNTCMVKFTIKGEVKEGAVEDMQDMN